MSSLRGVGMAAVILPLFMADQASADVGFPGFKRVGRRVCFENLNDYPDYAFFLTPYSKQEPNDVSSARVFGFPIRLDSGGVYPLGHLIRFNLDWILIAVPRGQVDSEGNSYIWKMLDAKNPGVLYSDTFKFPDYDSVILVYPIEYDLHHFRAHIVADKLTVTLTKVEGVSLEVGSVRVPTWLVGLLMTAAFLWLGIWWVRRRRARRMTAAITRSAALPRAPEK